MCLCCCLAHALLLEDSVAPGLAPANALCIKVEDSDEDHGEEEGDDNGEHHLADEAAAVPLIICRFFR